VLEKARTGTGGEMAVMASADERDPDAPWIPRRSRRRFATVVTRVAAGAVGVVLLLGPGVPCGPGTAGLGAPALAQSSAPALPNVTNSCVPASPTVVSPMPWPQQQMAPERAWELTRGDGVTVAVVDTGVSADSGPLTGAVRDGVDVAPGSNGGDADDDCIGYGTFVAGLIAARPREGVGFAGVAPGATIVPIRVSASAHTPGSGPLADGIREAVDAGADVIAVPAGTGEDSEALRAAVEYAQAEDALIVAAAYERSGRFAPPRYPASYPGVIAVVGVAPDGSPAEEPSPEAVVTLAAPGVDVISVAPHGNGHFTASGSWTAVGFVAGAAALVRAYLPELSAEQVLQRLITTADRPGRSLPDPVLGYGVVDPYSAVSAVLPQEAGLVQDRPAEVHPEVPQPELVDERPNMVVLAVIGGSVLLVVVVAVVWACLPRGQRRSWRPAGH